MVKGISRRVIVVRPPDTELFEQAIFILRDKVAEEGGVTGEQILQQAQRAADSYLRNRTHGGRGKGICAKPALYAFIGALSVSVLWAVAVLVL